MFNFEASIDFCYYWKSGVNWTAIDRVFCKELDQEDLVAVFIPCHQFSMAIDGTNGIDCKFKYSKLTKHYFGSVYSNRLLL